MDASKLVAQFRQRFVPSGTIVERAVRSGVWEGGMNTFNRLIQLAKVTILARLLPPEEFGILGIGFLVLAVFEHFSQLGIDQALIQRNEERVDEYLDTAWILQIFRGLLLSITVFIAAPFAATLFGEPRATNVIRILGLGPLLLGLKNPGVIYFIKGLNYHIRAVQVLSGTVVNFLVAVTLGVLLGNVWALVAGSVVGNVVSLFMSYFLHDYRPYPQFDLSRARELIDYGQWIFGRSITDFLIRQGDDVFVGWFLGATPLAFYQMAYRFSNAPATELTSVVTNVLFPSLSQLQDDYQKLREGYFRSLRLTTYVSFPAAAGIAIVAPTFVRTFLGSDWIATVPIMQALALWGALRALDLNNVPVFNTLSRPDIATKMGVVRVVLIALAIYPAAVQFGLLGVATVIVGTAAIVTPVMAYLTLRLIDEAPTRYLSTLVHPTAGSFVMVFFVWSVQNNSLVGYGPLELFVLVGTGIVVYAVYTAAALKLFNYRVVDELRMIWRAF